MSSEEGDKVQDDGDKGDEDDGEEEDKEEEEGGEDDKDDEEEDGYEEEDDEPHSEVQDAEEAPSEDPSESANVKSWNFPKMHLRVHLFDDIVSKGATRNFSTKPNEKMHGPI